MKDIPSRKVLNKIQEDIVKEFSNVTVTWGVHQDEGSQPHPEAEHGESIYDIARANHDGVPGENIPARPFVTQFTDANESKIKKKGESVVKKSILKKIREDIKARKQASKAPKKRKKTPKPKVPVFDVEKELMKVALDIEDQLREYIGSKPFEPNAASTIAKKEKLGRPAPDTPLVDTGELLMAIRGKVNNA